jgi:hypothetical protein
MEGQVVGRNRCQHRDEPYLPLLRDTTFQPIFILGPHRSGTTLLYRLLVATQCFNFVSAYHLIRCEEILFNHVHRREDHAREKLDALLKSLGLADRLIDNVTVTSDLPEEYGFMLPNARFRPQLASENAGDFVEFCKKIQFVSDPDRPLLLKNPWDFSNFVYVKKTLPTAKFIFIHRHPVHVINSLLKATRSLLDSESAYHALLDPGYGRLMDSSVRLFCARLLLSSHLDLGLRIVARYVARATSYFLEHVGELSDTDYVSVTYEDLCEDPESNVIKISSFLELKARANLMYEALIQSRPLRLLPEVARQYDRIQQKLYPYSFYCGYDR